MNELNIMFLYIFNEVELWKKYINKLVCDNIQDICRPNGEEPFTRVLTDEEYWEYFLKKMLKN